MYLVHNETLKEALEAVQNELDEANEGLNVASGELDEILAYGITDDSHEKIEKAVDCILAAKRKLGY